MLRGIDLVLNDDRNAVGVVTEGDIDILPLAQCLDAFRTPDLDIHRGETPKRITCHSSLQETLQEKTPQSMILAWVEQVREESRMPDLVMDHTHCNKQIKLLYQ